MLGADGNKPTGKPGQRKRKAEGKKPEARKRKSVQETVQLQDPQPDQLDAAETISAPVTPVDDAAALETFPREAETASEVVIAIEALPAETLAADSAPAAPEAASVTVAATAEASPTGLAAIDWSQAASPEIDPVPSAKPAMVASAEILPSTSAEAAPVSYQTIADAYGDLTRRSFDQTTSFFERFLGVRSFDKALELQTEFAKQAYDNFVAESQKIRDLHRELTRQRLQRWEGFVGMTKAR